jgi:hypothetical protein
MPHPSCHSSLSSQSFCCELKCCSTWAQLNRSRLSFPATEYLAACEKYTEAIRLCPRGRIEAAAYYGNRAICHLKEEAYTQCIDDCTKGMPCMLAWPFILTPCSVRLDRQWACTLHIDVDGLFRKGVSCEPVRFASSCSCGVSHHLEQRGIVVQHQTDRLGSLSSIAALSLTDGM